MTRFSFINSFTCHSLGQISFGAYVDLSAGHSLDQICKFLAISDLWWISLPSDGSCTRSSTPPSSFCCYNEAWYTCNLKECLVNKNRFIPISKCIVSLICDISYFASTQMIRYPYYSEINVRTSYQFVSKHNDRQRFWWWISLPSDGSCTRSSTPPPHLFAVTMKHDTPVIWKSVWCV
jgi:hypothetical protein